jgi:uncharacterized DUF497 family protein
MGNLHDDAFRWNDWNRGHIARHGVSEDEAEHVVNQAAPPYPERIGGGKWRVRGQTAHGRYLQVIFVIENDVYYVIHARGLTDAEKRRLRRRNR